VPVFGSEDRAVPGVEARRTLQRPCRRLDRIQRAAAAGAHGMACVEGGVEVGMDRALVVGTEAVALDDAGAAMDDQGDGVGVLRVHRDRISDRGLEPRPALPQVGATPRRAFAFAGKAVGDVAPTYCWRSASIGSSCDALRAG